MIKVVVVEDEEECRNTILDYLKIYSQEKDTEIKTEIYTNGMDFASDYRSDADIILLDIEMPFMNGMDAARKIRENDSAVSIVFITNMAQYAIKGYEVHAVDFIIKPIGYYGFADKLTKAIKYSMRNKEYEIVIGNSGSFVRLPVSEIFYIEKSRNDLVYYVKDGKYSERGSLSEIAERLKPHGFAVCSSGCIVNLRHISRSTGASVVVGGTELWISRRMKKSFFDAFMDYMGGYGK